MTSAGSSTIKVQSGNFIHIIGFHFENSRVGVEWRDSVGGLLKDCQTSGSEWRGYHIHASEVDIINCVSHNNSLVGFRICHGTTATLANCLAYGNTLDGFHVRESSTTATLWHCTSANNIASGTSQEDGNLTRTVPRGRHDSTQP